MVRGKTTLNHTKIFYLLFFATFIGFGVVSYQAVDVDSPQVQANQDNIDFLIQQNKETLEADRIILESLSSQAFDTAELRNQTNDKIQLNKVQIVKNKLAIDRNHPVGGNDPAPDPGDNAPTPIPAFTVNIEKLTYTAGENIVFSGVGLPGKPVFILLTAPDSSIAPQGASVADENGAWLVEFSSEFDWPTGTWTARATQLQERSDPLQFQLVE